MIAYGLHYQSLASQDESKVVQDRIAIRIFFKSLWSESIRTWTGVQFGETLTVTCPIVVLKFISSPMPLQHSYQEAHTRYDEM
jgi:hypothetical protein